jgi:hypothetical protein
MERGWIMPAVEAGGLSGDAAAKVGEMHSCTRPIIVGFGGKMLEYVPPHIREHENELTGVNGGDQVGAVNGVGAEEVTTTEELSLSKTSG